MIDHYGEAAASVEDEVAEAGLLAADMWSRTTPLSGLRLQTDSYGCAPSRSS